MSNSYTVEAQGEAAKSAFGRASALEIYEPLKSFLTAADPDSAVPASPARSRRLEAMALERGR